MDTYVNKPVRSPSYPSMPLNEAITAIRKIEAPYRYSPIVREDAVKLLGYSSLSGPASKALAALAAYGLVERAGKGEMRVTELAREILYPDTDKSKLEAVLTAARGPQLFVDIAERFDGICPPEDGLKTYLNRLGFNQNSINTAVKSYLGTYSYVEQMQETESHSFKNATDAKSVLPDEVSYGGAHLGDLVQWESSGALQFETPQRVRWVSDDGTWVAVEGSETGLPMSEIIVEERNSDHPKVAPTPPKISLAQEEMELKGEIEWMRNSLGPKTKVRIHVSGEIGPKEIGKLIRLLEAQKLVLEED